MTKMRNGVRIAAAAAVVICSLCIAAEKWKVHDMSRPVPKAVGVPDNCGEPPSNAIVLFDGENLDAFVSGKDGGAAGWKVEKGYMEVVPDSGAIRTKQEFGSCQLHVEWASPDAVSGTGQGRGNSGIFLMGRYEIQVLDCFENTSYADGMTGAVYGQSPPLFNACKKPGQWQSYDIVFTRPRFGEDGSVISPARVTILLNGVVVQANTEITGATAHKREAVYRKHADKLSLSLQDHGNPVRFRNIWIVELPED
jgi:hypothetical protein